MSTGGKVLPGSVFVTGAAGFVGFAVARAFRRAGYTVYGLTRKQDKAAKLQANEIIPVVGTSIEDYKKYVEGAQIVIDNIFSALDKDPMETPIALLRIAEEASKNRDPLVPPKTYIYTCGSLVYGHDERVRDETWPYDDSKSAAVWRRKVDEAVIQSPHLNGIVLRPGFVFGGAFNEMHAKWYFSNPEKLEFYGNLRDVRYSYVHIDDMAAAYLAAAEKASQVKGMVFNIINGVDNPKHVDVILAGNRLAGYKGEIHFKPRRTEGPHAFFDEILDSTVVLHPGLAMRLLEWTPKIFGLLENLEFYYKTVKAIRETEK